MNVFELFGTIAINNDDANRKIDQTGKLANNLTSIFKKVGTAVATVFAVDKIKDFGQACAQTYATIAAENSAFAQIMGDYSDIAKEKMQKVADETGVVASRLTPYMTSMTAKFKGLGYGIDEATSLATEGLTIASDAAAFWDKSLDESMSHLNSFINGSYEGGEAIGLFANDTQMASYAVRQGVVRETKEWSKLDEAKKQALRMQYAKEMYKQSGATGQAAKESGEYANVLANLKEHWRQLQGIIGKPIMQKMVLPALQKLNVLMPKINEKVQDITEKVTEGFESMVSYFKGTFEDVFTEDGINLSGVPKAFAKMFGDLSQKAHGWLSKYGVKLSNVWTGSVWPSIQEFMKVRFGVEMPSWAETEQKVSGWWGNVQAWWEDKKGYVTENVNSFTSEAITALSDVWQWAIGDGSDFIKAVAQIWISIKGIGLALAALSNPLLVLAVVAAYVITNWEQVKGAVDTAFDTTVSWLEKNIGSPMEKFRENVIEPLKKQWTEIVVPAITSAATAVDNFLGIGLVSGWDSLTTNLKQTWENVRAAVVAATEAVKTFLGLEGNAGLGGADARPWYVKDHPELYTKQSTGGGGARRSPTVTENAEGAIFSKPTIFDTRLGYQMVGEAGAEAVAPISKLQQYVSDAVKNTVGAMQFNVVLDTGVLVGQLAPRMDMQLGTLANRKGRG
ncbi:MAG: hypothetical protein IKY90_07120 [Oscillospiraceae bacterium]|nr:hypothetical protein [Oscillospiraceae bacterium]